MNAFAMPLSVIVGAIPVLSVAGCDDWLKKKRWPLLCRLPLDAVALLVPGIVCWPLTLAIGALELLKFSVEVGADVCSGKHKSNTLH